ncbi:MAG: carbon storage regulator [Polyangiaceae bacterium]
MLRRKPGERIVLGSEIIVSVASVTGRAVKLAIEAPRGVPVLRGEVFDAIVEANFAASEADEPASDEADTDSPADNGNEEIWTC